MSNAAPTTTHQVQPVKSRRNGPVLSGMAQWMRSAFGGEARRISAPRAPRSPFRFETMEPRLLLSADPALAGIVANAALELNLTENDDFVLVRQTGVAADGGVIVDLSMGALTQTYGDTSVGIRSIRADGLGGDDTFRFLDVTVPTQVSGGAGNDSLLGPDGDTEWNITGPDQGSVGSVSFDGIENLVGAAGNEDTFVLGAAGSVSGLVDGGPGGFDTLRAEAADYTTVVSSASGPDAGALEFDGVTLAYAGLEPIAIGSATNIVITGTAQDDHLVLETDPGNSANYLLRSANGTLESTSFAKAGLVSMRIDGAGGVDSIAVDASVVLGGGDFELYAETTTFGEGVAVTGAGTQQIFASSDPVVLTATDLNGVIDGLLLGFNRAAPPIGGAAIFGSSAGQIPDLITVGETLNGGFDLSMSGVQLSFANLVYGASGWAGQVGVEAQTAVLLAGLLDIAITDRTNDTDDLAVTALIDLAEGSATTIQLDDVDAETLGWPSYLNIEIVDLALVFPDFRGNENRNSLQFEAQFKGFDTGDDTINALISGDTPGFKLSLEGSASVVLALTDIEDAVGGALAGDVVVALEAALAAAVNSEITGVAGKVSGQILGWSLTAGFIVNTVTVDPDGAGPAPERSSTYLAVEGSISLGEEDTGRDWSFGMAFAISDLGPLQFFFTGGDDNDDGEEPDPSQPPPQPPPKPLPPPGTILLEEFRGGIRFNTSIEALQVFDDPVDITEVLEESGRFLIDSSTAAAVTSETLVTLTIAGHDLVAGNRFRIRSAGNAAFDGDFTVLTVNGDQVSYTVDANPGLFLGSAQVIRLSITDPLDLRRSGLDSGIAPPDSIFAWRDQLDQAVLSQLVVGPSWSSLFDDFVIGGGATVTISPTPDTELRFEVDLMIDGQGALLLSGVALMADGLVTIPASLYADLGELLDGNARFLALMDVPDVAADLVDPLLTLRGLISFETLAGTDVLNATVTPGAGAGVWQIELVLASDDPSSEYQVGDNAVLFGADPYSFDGTYAVVAVNDGANTITLQSTRDPGVWADTGAVARVANQLDMGGGFRIVLEGGVDVNIPAVTTLTLDGMSQLTVSRPGAGPNELLMDLSFDAALSEVNAGNLGAASGAFHLSIDTDVPASASNPLGGIALWGAALVDFDLGFLEDVGLFAPEISGLLRINTSNTAKPSEVLNGLFGPVTVALPASSFALRFDAELDFRIDFNGNNVFAANESAFAIDGTYVLEFSAAQGFNVAVFNEINGVVTAASIRIGPASAPLLNLETYAFLAIRESGIAGNFVLSGAADLPLGLASIEADFVLVFNTTGADVSFDVPSGARGPGPAGDLTLTIPAAAPANPSLVLASLDLDALIGGSAWTPAATVAPYAVVFLKGKVELLSVLTLDASGYILLGEGVQSMAVNVSGELLSVASVSGSAFFSSQGEFALSVAGSVQLGPDGFNLSGSASLDISYLDSDFAGSAGDGDYTLRITGTVQASGEIFYIPLPEASLSVSYDSDSGDITVQTGAVPVPGIGSYRVDPPFLPAFTVYYPTVSFKPYTFSIGNLALTPPKNPPVLGQVDANGVLTLNVGSLERRQLRDLQVDEENEEVLLDRVGQGSLTGDRIRITMFGVSQTVDNVNSILIADMGSGDDVLQISNRVTTPVEVHFGAGNDTLRAAGSGAVNAYGDGDDDDLAGGAGNDVLLGGTGNDVLRGGAGQDDLQGGDNDDLLVWGVGDGSDVGFDGQGGQDAFRLVGSDAADSVVVGDDGTGLVFGIGASQVRVVGVEAATIASGKGADTITFEDLSASLLAQIVVELGADAVADTVIVHGSDGADSFQVTTQLAERRTVQADGSTTLSTAAVASIGRSGGTVVNIFDAGLGLAGDMIMVDAGAGADTIDIFGTLAGTVTTVAGGTGAGTFNVGAASVSSNPLVVGSLGGVQGALNLIGAAGGADTLNLSDADYPAQGGTRTGALSATRVSGLGLVGALSYQDMEALDIQLGASADRFTVLGTAAGTVTHIDAGAGDDSLFVHSVTAPLTLDGAAGADRFYVSSNAGLGTDPLDASAGDLAKVTGALVLRTGDPGIGGARDAIYFSAAGSPLAFNTGGLLADQLIGLGNPAAIRFETNSGVDLHVALTGGNDSFRVHAVAAGNRVFVRGGLGQDTLDVGDSAGLLAGIRGDVNFAGDGGFDKLNVHSASPSQPPGLLTALRVTGLDLGSGAAIVYADSVDLSTVEAVNVFLGSGADVFSVDSTHVSVTTGIHGGGGSDILRVGTTGSLPYPGTLDLLTHIDGVLTFDGGEGEDVVRLNNSGNGADIVGTFSDTSITGLGNAAPILLAGAESVEILLGVGDDTFYVSSTALGSHLTLGTGGGDDTVYLGTSPSEPHAGSLDGLLGSVTVDGGAGALDTLFVNDQTTPTAKAWVVSNTPDLVTPQGVTFDQTVVARSGAAAIRYQFMEAVSLNAGDGADTIEIQATHRERDSLGGKSASFVVNAGGGADRIVLGKPGPDGALLDGFAVGTGIPSAEAGDGAPVFIDGQAGEDRIEFDHAGGASPSGANASFSSRSFADIVPPDQAAQTAQFARLFGEDPAGFDPDAARFDTLVLSQAGRGGALNVYSRNAENVQLILGAADDTVQVTTGTYQHALTVDGGAGNDSFLLENGADHQGRAVVFNGGADDDLAFVDFSRASTVDRGNLAGTVTGVAVPGAALGTLAAGLPELAGGNYFVETRQSGTSAADWQFRLVDASGAPVTVALLNGGDPTSDWQRIADIAAGNGGLFDTQRGLLVQFGDDPSLYQAGSWSSDPGSRTAAHVLLGVPTAAVHLTFNGGHHSAEGEGDTLRIAGDGSSAGGEYRPNALLANAGTVDLQGNTITFTGVEPLVVHRLPDFKVITPDDPANLSIGAVDVGALNLSELSLHVVTVDGVVTWTQAGALKGAESLGQVRQFASSMAMSANGQFLVVGAERYVDALGQESGVVFLFSWDAASASWVETLKLYAPDSDGAGVGAGFGQAVALDGVNPNDPSDLPTQIIVGAPRDTTFAGKAEHGAAYVFSRFGTGWTFQRKLLASDAQANDHFGSAVAAAYEQALIGAPGNGGNIYFFQQQGAGLWAEQATVTNQAVPSGAGYGTAVALISDRAVVALPGQNRAYVFVRNPDPATPRWQESAQLSVAGLGQASEQLTLDRNNNGRWDAGDGFVDANANGRFDSPEFGYSVALAQLGGGSLQAVVGAPGWNGGAAVRTVADVNVDLSMFLYPASSFEVSLRGPDGTEVVLLTQGAAAAGRILSLGTVLDDEATRSINESATGTITGAYRPSQSLSAFDGKSAAGDWVLRVTDKVSGGVSPGEFYGWGLTLTFDDGSSERRSLPSTFVYVPDAPAAPVLSTVTVPPGVATQVGKAFVFHGAGANWTRVADLGADSGLAGAAALAAGKSGDRFGESVALLGSNLVVGATGVDHSGVVDAGAAYLFTGSDAWTLAGAPAPVAIKLVGATPNGGGGVRGAADSFGHSVAIGGGRILVGIPGFDETAGATVLRADVGSVHTFSRVVTDVNVTLNIRHPFNADLDVYLTGPTGKQVELFTDVGGSSDNFFGTTLDDQAVASITNGTGPFSGSYRPEGLLGLFNGDSATGTWQLSVTDDDSDFFTPQQSLNSWSLTFTFSDGSVQTFAATSGLGPIPDPGFRTSNLVVPGPASGSLLVPQAIKTAKAGSSVAIDGDWAVVGAPDYDNRGAVFIYRRDGPADADGNPDWVYQTLLQPEGIRAGDDFGYSVTLSDGVLAIGSPGSNNDGGVLYIYQRIGDGWSQQFRAAGSPGWRLGQAVDASDNVVVVGAPGFSNGVDQPGIGIAFSYERVEFEWVRKGQYFARAFGAGASFGTSVAIEGSTVVVGAPGSSIDIDGQTVTTSELGGSGAGAIGVYVAAEDGGVKLQQIWTMADGLAGDRFGQSVDISGGRIVAGAPGADRNGISNAGAAYAFSVFDAQYATGALVTGSIGPDNIITDVIGLDDRARLDQGQGVEFSEDDFFGHSVAIDNERLVVGAYGRDRLFNGDVREDSGEALAYGLKNGVWRLETDQADEQLFGAGAGSGDQVGYAVAISGDNALLGAPQLAGRLPSGPATDGQGYAFVRTVSPPLTVVTPELQTVLIAGASANTIEGTIGLAAVQTAMLRFFDIEDVTVRTGAGADTIALQEAGLVAHGLVNFYLETGGGNDMLRLEGRQLTPPAAREQFELTQVAGGSAELDYQALIGAFHFDGGAGVDTIASVAGGSWMLEQDRLVAAGNGALLLTRVEDARLQGGPDGDYFGVRGWQGTLTLDGKEGSDTYELFITPGTHITVDDTGVVPFTFATNQVGRPTTTEVAIEDYLLINGTDQGEALVLENAQASVGDSTVGYAGIEQITMAGGGGDDFLRFKGSGARTVELVGQDGNDFYDVSPGAASVAPATLPSSGQQVPQAAGLEMPVAVRVRDESRNEGDIDTLLNEVLGTGVTLTYDRSIDRFGGAPTVSVPDVTASAAQSAAEGQTATLDLGSFTDASGGTWTVNVDWGDGSTLDAFVRTVAGTIPPRAHTYVQDGDYTVQVSVRKNVTGSLASTGSFTVAVANAAPTLSNLALDAATITEGNLATVRGRVVDAGTLDSFLLAIDWGDGSPGIERIDLSSTAALPSNASFDPLARDFVVTHRYLADNPGYAIALTVTDDAGAGGTGALTVTVLDAGPTARIVGADVVVEGTTSLYSASTSTSFPDTIVSYAWDLDGDGAFDDAVGATASRSFDANGAYTVGLRVTDSDGSVDETTLAVTVLDAAPTAALTGTALLVEGGTGQFDANGSTSSPDAITGFEWDWDYDGNTFNASADPGATQSHLFADDGVYTVAVRVTDLDGSTDVATMQVTVQNVAPTLALGGPSSVLEGSTYTLAFGAITDPGMDTVSQYRIDWGDGSAAQTLSAVALAALSGNVDHVYADGLAAPTITVDVTDENGLHMGAGSLSLEVLNVAPTVQLAGDASVNEGSVYTLDILNLVEPGDDTLNSITIDWGDGVDAGVLGANTHTYADDGQYTITVRLQDEDGGYEFTHTVDVLNVAPTMALNGALAPDRTTFVLTLGAITDPGEDAVTDATVHWGDGTRSEVRITGGNNAARGPVTHVYANGQVPPRIVVDLLDRDGEYPAAGVLDIPLQVVSLTPDASGFDVQFNRALDASVLNLYSTQNGGEGPADVTLTGAASGNVKGSVVLDADGAGLRFIKTGGALAADSYTVTLRSASNGFIDLGAGALDGDANGVAGGNHVVVFNTSGAGALLSIGDIARGPGQGLNLPASGAGVPVKLSDAVGATQVAFTLAFDTTLLNVTGAVLGADAPAGSSLVVDLSQPGQMTVRVSLGAALTSASAQALVRIEADVPVGASGRYTEQSVLDLRDVSVNGGAIAARGDDGVFVNAYIGDANGNQSYNSLDVQRLQRVVVQFDAGFASYLLLDPVILGDTSGDGRFNSLDVLLLQQRVVGLPQTAIPALPSLAAPATAPGVVVVTEPAQAEPVVAEVVKAPQPDEPVVEPAVAAPVTEPAVAEVVEVSQPAAPVAEPAMAAPVVDAPVTEVPIAEVVVAEPTTVQPSESTPQASEPVVVPLLAASAPVVDLLADPPVVNMAGATALVIDWAGLAEPARPSRADNPGRWDWAADPRRNWVSDFVNRMGRAESARPNDAMKLTLPAAAKTSASLRLLDRQ